MTNRNEMGKNLRLKRNYTVLGALCANIFEAGLTCTALTGRAINILPTKAVNIGCLPQFSSLCDDKRKNSLEMLGKQKRIKKWMETCKMENFDNVFPDCFCKCVPNYICTEIPGTFCRTSSTFILHNLFARDISS